MIARLVGTLVSRDGNRAVIDVRDVGYAVHGPLHAVAAWAESDEPVEIFVSTDVREDAITLYGFATDTDRRAFEVLRGVNGVGPKLALAALDTLGLQALAAAIAKQEVATLARIPGVGKKLAQRLALELEGKLVVGFSAELADAQVVKPTKRAADDQLDLALARLGYTRSEIVRAHRGLEEAEVPVDAPVSERLRVALRVLSGS